VNESQPSPISRTLTSETTDVAVAGAGIVGLAFALALSEGGSSIAVIAPDAKSKTVNAATEALETRVYALK
jgi:2-polyprenyl-6-methoxyphenol hydroxylase-like FAD-dependent oxidoreductase